MWRAVYPHRKKHKMTIGFKRSGVLIRCHAEKAGWTGSVRIL